MAAKCWFWERAACSQTSVSSEGERWRVGPGEAQPDMLHAFSTRLILLISSPVFLHPAGKSGGGS